MATRFYFPSTGAAAITPALAATWTEANELVSLAAVTAKISSAEGNPDAYKHSAVNPGYVCVYRYVTDVLGELSWSSSDTMKAQMICRNDSPGMVDYLHIIVRVVSGDGATVRGTLFNGHGNTDIAAESGVNRTVAGTLADVSQQDGDRLVIELGTYGPNTTSWVAFQLNIGDAQASDLPENETETGHADYSPWIEFSPTIPGEGEGGDDENIVMNII